MKKFEKITPVSEIRSVFIYDDEGIVRWKKSRRGVKALSRAGYFNNFGTLIIKYNGMVFIGYRIIWALINGEWPDDEIDHIDGDRTNNKIENLRSVTHSINMRNRKLHKNNKSGICGVYLEQGRWKSEIKFCGKKICLGSYGTIFDAAAERIKAEARYGFSKSHGRR